ncbi:hypothetical protein [Paenibacillus polymyxa]|nr:hypothetical protein [Paenibacillus polymyxa]WDZ55089.1 hypothetical protein MF622_10285 [Paenibacillus polymyxa]
MAKQWQEMEVGASGKPLALSFYTDIITIFKKQIGCFTMFNGMLDKKG